VAALTMPALVANYQKKVVTTRLQKFASLLRNIHNMRLADTGTGEFICSMLTANNNSDMTLAFWSENYAPYMKTIAEPQKVLNGILVPLVDGGGMYIQKTSDSGAAPSGGSCAALNYVYCLNYKECLNNPPTLSAARVAPDGKSKFRFRPDREGLQYFGSGVTDLEEAGGREAVLARCKNENGEYYLYYYCTELIMIDGWEIKDDYPWL
jgi:hypothetical protein